MYTKGKRKCLLEDADLQTAYRGVSIGGVGFETTKPRKSPRPSQLVDMMLVCPEATATPHPKKVVVAE
jgi:hypothetical protein